VSCKLAGGLAKLRLSFQSDPQGQGIFGEDPAQQLFAAPLVGFITKHFSVLYDVEERNTLLNGDASLPGGAVQLRSSLDVKVSRYHFESRYDYLLLPTSQWCIRMLGTYVLRIMCCACEFLAFTMVRHHFARLIVFRL
jgi:hypothetical protein